MTNTTGQERALKEALEAAYIQGATDVHKHWTENPGEAPRGDPEFGEAASDYAEAALDPFDSSVPCPALALPHQPATEEGDYEARYVHGGAPTNCVDYGVIRKSAGKEVCRVWHCDDAEMIARLLNASPMTNPPSPASDTMLREALEPFAKVADEYCDSEDDSFEVWQDAGPIRTIRASFRLENYRHARAALKAAGGDA